MAIISNHMYISAIIISAITDDTFYYLVKCTLAPGVQCKEMSDGGVFMKTQPCRYT